MATNFEAREREMRSRLWNDVEARETRKNSRLGRELQLGFAIELSHDEQDALLRDFVQRVVVDRGFVADVAFHDYGKTLPAIGRSPKQDAQLHEWTDAELPFLEADEAKGLNEEHVRIRRDRPGNATGFHRYNPHARIRFTPRRNDQWQVG